MDKEKNAYDQLVKGIQSYVQKVAEDVPRDITVTGIITDGGTNVGYKVKINNVIYDNVKTIGGNCLINETVRVLIPQNNYSNMFILKSGQGGGSEITVDNFLSTTSENPVQNKVLTNKINDMQDEIDDNTSARHTHTNKTVLNGITASKVVEWNNKSTFSGDYNDLSNKPTSLSDFSEDSNHRLVTDVILSNISSNTSARHTHSNKTVLDGISSSDISNWNNKSDFDGSYNSLTDKPTIPTALSELSDDSTHRLVTDAILTNISNNTSARHTHSNKSVLDGINASRVSDWDGKVTQAELKTVSDKADSNGNKIAYILSGESSEDFQLTDDMINLVSKDILLKGNFISANQIDENEAMYITNTTSGSKSWAGMEIGEFGDEAFIRDEDRAWVRLTQGEVDVFGWQNASFGTSGGSGVKITTSTSGFESMSVGNARTHIDFNDVDTAQEPQIDVVGKTNFNQEIIGTTATFSGNVTAPNILEDTGWKQLTPASGFTNGTFGKKGIFYRKIGNKVSISYSFIDANGFSGSSRTVATLPSGYRPQGNEYRLCACAGANIARMYVNASGAFALEYVRKMSDGTNYTTSNTWHEGLIEFYVD